VQSRFGNETALAAEVTETLPQALKRDPRTAGSYARLKACSTHRLYTRCETALAPDFRIAGAKARDQSPTFPGALKRSFPRINAGAPTKKYIPRVML
jgi:hypothetical protein